MSNKNVKQGELAFSLNTKLFYSICGVLVLVLPFFYLSFVNDRTLMPRLLLLDLFLAGFIVILFLKRNELKMNFSVLRNPLMIVFLLNFLITLLSQFVAVNIVEGFFDTVKTFTMVLLCFLLIQMFLVTPDWPERLSVLVLIATAIALIVGFFQYFQYVVFNTTTKLPDGRPTIYLVRGLMSHKNLFSSSLMLMLPFIGIAIFKFKETLRAVAVIVFSLVVILLVLLETRAVWVGLLVGGFVFVLILVLLAKQFEISKKHRLFLGTGLMVTTLVFAGIIFSGGGEKEQTYFDRLKTITKPNSGNNSFRLRAWDATLEMIADHPLTGVGAGNWKIHSQKYFTDKNFKQTETNWIRPHNDYLWAMAERGLFGFILFIALFGIAIYYAVKLLLSNNSHLSTKVTVLLLFSGLVSYMFDSFFNFPYERINHQVYLTIFIAGITTEYFRMNPEKKTVGNQKYLFASVGIFLGFSILYGFSMVKSEYHIVRAKAAEESQNWNLLIEESTKAKTPFRTLEPDASPIDYYIGKGYLETGNLKTAAKHYHDALKVNPFDPFVYSNLGKVYTDMGEYRKGVNNLEHALKLLPGFFEAKVNLGTAYYHLKEYRKALKALNSIPRRQRTSVIKGNIVALKKLIAENQKTTPSEPAGNQSPKAKDEVNPNNKKKDTPGINDQKKGNQKKQNVNKQKNSKNQINAANKNQKKGNVKDTTKMKKPAKNQNKKEKKNP